MRMFFSGLMESLKENKITFLWVLLFFLVGIVLGSYTVYYMSDFNRVEITTYFNNFLEFLGGNSVSYTSILVDSIKSILPMVAIIVLLGYTAVGTPIILMMDLAKGYVIGFTFSLIVSMLGSKGVMLVLSGLMLQNLIFIPIIMLISVLAIRHSVTKLKMGVSRDRVKLDVSRAYLNFQGLLSLIIISGILIETYISPNLIRLVISR
ncbi:stage II sporulation protein M [Clostridium perfringens]|uniref:Stage II sporulation protein M n=7 Tax=Clostridium perfringens TaxID=1502 RepID=A0A317TXJ9_CLOPF|nr:stage II sporulation protein M [Clostridium perfringens]EDT79775.1 putative sporulation protein [Clostridium perfringens NCTC 8239]ABG82248.1 stage II sporulation protein M [Clostridium perfringens ATCC 13124]ALG49418.1 Stage II sporulation protein M (SpoIIM) [Clostridium perfringens]AXH53016.1 stage II sporulation protein M [Clostridium perfringens]EDS80272.1 putative sporulation protein [Clostridium perfringens C str. JGS1495]